MLVVVILSLIGGSLACVCRPVPEEQEYCGFGGFLGVLEIRAPHCTSDDPSNIHCNGGRQIADAYVESIEIEDGVRSTKPKAKAGQKMSVTSAGNGGLCGILRGLEPGRYLVGGSGTVEDGVELHLCDSFFIKNPIKEQTQQVLDQIEGCRN